MAKTAAEKQRAYRDRKKAKGNAGVTSGGNIPSGNAQESNTPCAENIRPLDVYCERRWSYLQERGYVWVPEKGRACKYSASDVVNIGVVVPGDPAYEGIG